ncbi:MAG: hypothetical protein PHQ63_04900 [Smithellaceae bacterium]|nr:hypothetical protein [Smithellaceae bacterium]
MAKNQKNTVPAKQILSLSGANFKLISANGKAIDKRQSPAAYMISKTEYNRLYDAGFALVKKSTSLSACCLESVTEVLKISKSLSDAVQNGDADKDEIITMQANRAYDVSDKLTSSICALSEEIHAYMDVITLEVNDDGKGVPVNNSGIKNNDILTSEGKAFLNKERGESKNNQRIRPEVTA